MSNPYESPQEPDNPFREQPADLPNTQGPGMVNQVQIVCILMIVQGALVMCMGLFYVGYAFFFPVLFEFMESTTPSGGSMPPEQMTWIMTAVLLGLGLPILLSGSLQIWAGIRNLRFRGRTLGMVALIGGGVSLITCYCAPTGIALLVYGLIVYLNQEVTQAFQMGERGFSRQQILAAFWPYRPQVTPVPPKPAEE